jgi:hypothetical protein
MNTNYMRLGFMASGLLMAMLLLQGHAAWVQSVKASSDVDNAKTATLQRQQSDIAIAESRFKNGCVQIGIAGGTPVQISVGMAVYGHSADGVRNPLADGTVICDRWGGTAVMRAGAAVEFASSPKYAQEGL